MALNIKEYLAGNTARPLILDGGLGSQLEDTGFDNELNDPLWSAVALIQFPDAVKNVHTSFLNSGADIITIATYQASEAGLRESAARLKLKSDEDIANVFIKSIMLADESREEFWQSHHADKDRVKPFVAGSVGPFGAYMADRSEYTGYYPSIESNFEKSIRDFHYLRLKLLLRSEKVDFTILETIPNFEELKILIDLSHEIKKDALYSISLSLKSPNQLADGTDLKTVLSYINDLPAAKFSQIVAVGTNCSPLVHSLETVQYIMKHNSKNLPIIVYPNSGEVYDKSTRTHSPDPLLQKFASENNLDRNSFHDILTYLSTNWVKNGAKLVGGCCRITPEHIKWIHDSIL